MKTPKENDSDVFRVYARIRPLLDKEILESQNKNIINKCISTENNTIFITDPHCTEFYSRKEKQFNFDEVFDENYDNKFIYNRIIKNLVDKSLQGYNSTALAYGVTGTGKTHTMFGDIRNTIENLNDQQLTYLKDLNNINYDSEIQKEYVNLNSEANKIKEENKLVENNNQFGICIYAVDYMFKKIKELILISKKNSNQENSNFSLNSMNKNKNNNNQNNDKFSTNNNINNNDSYSNFNDNLKSFSITLTYLEIYNEQVIDLLSERGDKSDPLLILEDPVKGICIPDITQYKIFDVSQVINLILLGNSRRTMASTSANQFSSRSHAILEFNIEQINLKSETSMNSKLCLVDLAGSERGGMEKGARREEGANINKSLLALGNCINILSDRNKKTNAFVPYRDSKLTRLLKDSLSGNISTIMIACVSPGYSTYEETLNTLKYASRARKIQKTVTKNINDIMINGDICSYKELIENLKTEVYHLKDIIRNHKFLLSHKNFENFEKGDFYYLNEENLNNNIISNKIDAPSSFEDKNIYINNQILNHKSANIIRSKIENQLISIDGKNGIEEQNKRITFLEDEKFRKLNQHFHLDQNLLKEYLFKLGNCDDLVNDEKFQEFQEKLLKLNYEKLIFENLDFPKTKDYIHFHEKREYEKDEKFIAIRNNLQNFFKIIVEAFYKNSKEIYKLKKKIKLFKKPIKDDKFNSKRTSSLNSDCSLSNDLDKSLENSITIDLHNKQIECAKNNIDDMNLEEDKIEKNEKNKSQNLKNIIDNNIGNNFNKEKYEQFETNSYPTLNKNKEDYESDKKGFNSQEKNYKNNNSLEILKNNLKKKLLFKKNLEKFLIIYLSTKQYKESIETNFHLFELQNKTNKFNLEINNYENKITQLTNDSANKDIIIKNLLEEIESIKNSIVPEKYKSLVNHITYGEKYRTKLLNKRNRSMTKRKISKKLIRLYNFYEVNEKSKLNKNIYNSELKNNYNYLEENLLTISENDFNNIINKNSENKTFNQNHNLVKINNNYSINHKKTKSSASSNYFYQDSSKANLQSKHNTNISKEKMNFLKMKKHINSILVYSNKRINRIANSTDLDKEFFSKYKNKTTNLSKEKSINVQFNKENKNLKKNQQPTTIKYQSNLEKQCNFIDLGNHKKIPIVTASLEDSQDNEVFEKQNKKSKSINENELLQYSNKKQKINPKHGSIELNSNFDNKKSKKLNSNRKEITEKKLIERTKNVVINLDDKDNIDEELNFKNNFSESSSAHNKSKQKNIDKLKFDNIENNNKIIINRLTEKEQRIECKSITLTNKITRRNTYDLNDPKNKNDENLMSDFINEIFSKKKNVFEISNKKENKNIDLTDKMNNKLFKSLNINKTNHKIYEYNKIENKEKNRQMNKINNNIEYSDLSTKNSQPIVNTKLKNNNNNLIKKNYISRNENTQVNKIFRNDYNLSEKKEDLFNNNIYRANSDLLEYSNDLNNYFETITHKKEEEVDKNFINDNNNFQNKKDGQKREEISKKKDSSVSPTQNNVSQNAKLECLRKSYPRRDFISNNNITSEKLVGKFKMPEIESHNRNDSNFNIQKNPLTPKLNIVSFTQKYENLNDNNYKQYEAYRNDILNKIENSNNELLKNKNKDLNPIGLKDYFYVNEKENSELLSFTNDLNKRKKSEKSINLFENKDYEQQNPIIPFNSEKTANFFGKKISFFNGDEKDQDNNSLIISAVMNNNNEFMLNSSEVEILQNVLNFENPSNNSHIKNDNFNNNFDLFLENVNLGINSDILSKNNQYNMKYSNNNLINSGKILNNFNNDNILSSRGLNYRGENMKKIDSLNNFDVNNSKKLFSICTSKKDTSKAFEEALNKMKQVTSDRAKNGKKNNL